MRTPEVCVIAFLVLFDVVVMQYCSACAQKLKFIACFLALNMLQLMFNIIITASNGKVGEVYSWT